MKMETQTHTTDIKPNPLAVKFPDLKPTLDKIGWADTSFEEIPAGMSAISVMGEPGDTKHIWDKRKDDEVEAARSLFKSLTKKGYRAFRVTGKDGEKGEQMNEFDADAERMILVPQMAGG
jgi:hypothetical protein